MKRRDFCRIMAAAGGSSGINLLPAMAQVRRAGNSGHRQIYQLQAAFHRAKTAQDVELMMSLWTQCR
jgi:hypothetical protein